MTVQQKSTSILQIVSLTATDPRFDSLYLSNYATINLVPELSRLPGVGNVNVFGVGQYSMRIWLDPQTLHARRSDAAGRDQRDPATEPAGHGGSDRCATGAGEPGLPVHGECRGTPGRSDRIRQHRRQGRYIEWGPDHAREGRRAGGTGCADLLAGLGTEQQAVGRRRDLPVAECQCAECGDTWSMRG